MSHWYHAFGLTIRSSLPLPELMVLPAASDSAGKSDVEIAYGHVPSELPDALVRRALFEAGRGRILLNLENVARYLVSDGRMITIEPASGVTEDEVRPILLTAVMGALLHQRNDLVLHGSAVATSGGAIGFLGHSGAGKSTLATALRKRGYPVLTDDLCVVRPQADGVPAIQPGFPHMKLWLDSLRELELSAEGLRRIQAHAEKRALPLGEEFSGTARPLRKLYVLRPTARDEITLTPAQSAMRFRILKNQTYRFGLVASIEQKTGHFHQAFKLAQQVPLSIVVRPTVRFRLDELVDLIEADLRG